MLYANQIRLGNLFHPISRHTEVHLPQTLIFLKLTSVDYMGEVTCLHHDLKITQHEPRQYSIRDLSPIEITESLLLKCGFYKMEEQLLAPVAFQYELQIKPFHDGNTNKCVIHFLIAKDKYTGSFTVNDYWASRKIKYLHELQNLYFILTGEELTINL